VTDSDFCSGLRGLKLTRRDDIMTPIVNSNLWLVVVDSQLNAYIFMTIFK